MTFDIPYHFPSFLWRFWLLNPGRTEQVQSAHTYIYDVYANDLSECFSVPSDATPKRPVFHDFDDGGLYPGPLHELQKAEEEFSSLETHAEQILADLIDVIYPSLSHGTDSASSTAESFALRSIPIGRAQLSTLVKFFVFLRFRNSGKYMEIVNGLTEQEAIYVHSSGSGSGDSAEKACWRTKAPVLEVYNPLLRQVRCKAVLRSFVKFFRTDFSDTVTSDVFGPGPSGTPSDPYLEAVYNYCWLFCRDADVCLGVSSQDQEFVLPDRCFGDLDEAYGGEEARNPECYDSFFPILPTLAVYIIGGTPQDSDPSYRISKNLIEIAIESASDIHLRNSMILSTIPHHQNVQDYHIRISFPSPQLETTPNDIIVSCSSFTSPPICEISLVSSTVELVMSGPKLYFSSTRSIVQSISLYNTAQGHWGPGQFIDYSRLKQMCRMITLKESMAKMIIVKGEIAVVDLTDDVALGKEAIAFGAFSDVWQGEWWDRVEMRQRTVAVKFLRQVMVQGVKEKLMKRLQAELTAWLSLCHRNVSQLFGVVQSPTSVGMVSPWCSNGTIGSYLRNNNPQADKLRLLIQIASGVAYLHSVSPPVVHGDLKGGNILIDGYGQAIITDFGLSKVLKNLSESVPDMVGASSFFAGSTRWMAPELILALVEDEGIPQVTTYSDVYAFAAVCLEIITGQLPYAHRTNDHSVTVDILRGVKPSRGSVLSCAFLRLRPLRNRQDPEEAFRDILDRCWHEVPYLRPTMGEVLQFLIGLEGVS